METENQHLKNPSDNKSRYITRLNDDRWTKEIIEWRARQDAFSSRGHPPTKRHDDLKCVHSNRMQSAQDRELRKQAREAYIQQ
ncbi:hypothetical protein Trydic_g19224 [Trypoxylus dichotomus]